MQPSLEQQGTDGRLGIRRFEYGFRLSLERADVAYSHADAYFLTAPQRDHYSRTSDYRILETVFKCIVECLEERKRQCDVDEPRSFVTHFETPPLGLWSVRGSRRGRGRP